MDAAISQTKGLQIAPAVKETDTQDGIVLLDVHGGMCFPLDQVGTLIWKQLRVGNQIDEIARQIADQFHIPITQAAGDVREFVLQLQSNGLLCERGKGNAKDKPTMIATMGMLWRRLIGSHQDHAG